MNNFNVFFDPVPNTFYKIVPVQDPTKAFTYNTTNQQVTVAEFQNT